MSTQARQHNGQSPYQRSNRTWRARGPMLVLTAVVLAIALSAWIVTYTRSLETTHPERAGQVIDPGVAKAARH